jgi:cytochrome P450 family 144
VVVDGGGSERAIWVDASLLRELVHVTLEIPWSLLLDPTVIDDPYPFYRQLRDEAPVWRSRVPGCSRSARSTSLPRQPAESEDFSSNLRSVLHRDDKGLPCRITFGDGTGHVLATADPPRMRCTAARCSPN